MHVLRSTYIPAYDSLIRPPYTSDPFPLALENDLNPNPHPPPSPYGPIPPSPSSSLSSLSNISQLRTTLNTIQRETAVLDLFIALKVREDVWADDTELHLERDEAYKDLFDHAQPRARLEDLVRVYGLRDGVITLSSTVAIRKGSTSKPQPTSKLPTQPTSSPVSPQPQSTAQSILSSLGLGRSKPKSPPPDIFTVPSVPQPISPVPFHLLSISFSPRQIGLVLLPSKRTIVTTQRASRDEKLEKAAKRIVQELRVWLQEGG